MLSKALQTLVHQCLRALLLFIKICRIMFTWIILKILIAYLLNTRTTFEQLLSISQKWCCSNVLQRFETFTLFSYKTSYMQNELKRLQRCLVAASWHSVNSDINTMAYLYNIPKSLIILLWPWRAQHFFFSFNFRWK